MIDFDCVDSGSSQNRSIYRKQLTRKRLVHSIDSSLDESNFEPIVYVNRNGNFETLTGYLGPKTNNNTKTMSWDSEFPSVTGRQRTCDIIHRPISCLLPNTNASNIETFDDTFNLFLDDEIMDMIAHNTNNKIRETLLRFRNNHPAFANSNKNAYVKEMPHAIRRDVNGLGLMVQLIKKLVPWYCFCSTRT